jgi:hypothetical protein
MRPDEFSAQPNSLRLDRPFTDGGLRALADLEGLVGLNLFWHTPAFMAAGLKAFGDVSALRRRYRDVLREGHPSVQFESSSLPMTKGDRPGR